MTRVTNSQAFLLPHSRRFAVFEMLPVGFGEIVVAVVIRDKEIVFGICGIQCGVYRLDAGIRNRTCGKPLSVIGVIKLIVFVRLLLTYIGLDAAL